MLRRRGHCGGFSRIVLSSFAGILVGADLKFQLRSLELRLNFFLTNDHQGRPLILCTCAAPPWPCPCTQPSVAAGLQALCLPL